MIALPTELMVTVIVTMSPTWSGGGVSEPDRFHRSASAPVEAVPEARTSPAPTQASREAWTSISSKDQDMCFRLSPPTTSPLIETVISRS